MPGRSNVLLSQWQTVTNNGCGEEVGLLLLHCGSFAAGSPELSCVLCKQ